MSTTNHVKELPHYAHWSCGTWYCTTSDIIIVVPGLLLSSTISAGYNPRLTKSNRVFILETLINFVHIASNQLHRQKDYFYFVGDEEGQEATGGGERAETGARKNLFVR